MATTRAVGQEGRQQVSGAGALGVALSPPIASVKKGIDLRDPAPTP